MGTTTQKVVAGHNDAGKITLAVALGNPGERYQATRHNAGIWLVEALAHARGLSFGKVSDIAAQLAGTANDLRLAFVEEFMNLSGTPVQRLMQFLKVEPASVIILHDEADLPAGVARLKFGGGLAGHNGLRDIAARLGTQQFWRLRLGVGPLADVASESDQYANEELASYVLRKPPTAERAQIDAAIAEVVGCWDLLAAGQMDEAIRQLHTVEPPKS